jgi:long-chain acyl-CoA synthetase
MLTIDEALARVVKKRGKHPFINFHDRSISYEEFGRKVEGWRDALWGHGFKEGDRAVIMATNSPEWCEVYLAVIAAGGVAVPLESALDAEHLTTLLNQCGAKIIFTSRSESRRVDDILPSLTDVEHAVVIDGAGRADSQLVTGVNFLKKKGEASPSLNHSEKICTILYTAGTTGDPKAVPLTHRNLLSGVAMGLEMTSSRRNDCVLNPLPLYHVFSLVDGFLAPLLGGMELVLTDRLDRNSLRIALADHPVSILICVPAFYSVMHQRIRRKFESMYGLKGGIARWFLRRSLVKRSPYLLRRVKYFMGRRGMWPWSRVRLFISGGAPLDHAVMHSFNALGLDLMEGYGMTETCAAVVLNTSRRYRLGSVGRPDRRWVNMRIDKPNGNGVGEILLRSPMVTQGYIGQPREDYFDRDGYFRTGDMGYLDNDGYLYITGRSKDVMIQASGKNVYPPELEAYYIKSSLIKDICIFGIPADEKKNEILHAAIVVTDQLLAHGEEVAYEWLASEINKLSKKLPAYKRVKSFSIWRGDFPRVSTGEVKKHEVRNQIIEHVGKGAEEPIVSVADEMLMTHPEAHYLCQQLLELAPKKVPIFPTTMLEADLGMDSARITELIARLEAHYNRRLSSEQVMSASTVKDVIVALERCLHKSRMYKYQQRFAHQ